MFSSRFVGGHPMTGSEYAGIKGADRYLFENALYVLTPTPRTDPAAVAEIKKIVAEVGARNLCLSPHEHDLIVATVSHLPHFLALTLMNYAGKLALSHPETLLLAAGGFRDVTRVASGHPAIWRDIYASNREHLVNTCRQFRELLREMEQYLEQGDFGTLVTIMEEARREREKIPLKIRGFLPAVYEVVVTVPDRPGTIAHVAGILGERGINIIDIEILRVREGDGGTIRLAFAKEAEAELALRALRENGVIVKRR
jgi:prephenate dehydrogenase